MTGSVEIDDSIVGVFFASGDPIFVRSETLYSGAVISSAVVANGNEIFRMGGDVWLLDAAAPLAGDDHYEITGVVDMGSVGAAAPQSLVFVAEHNDATFSLSNGTPLFAPSFDVRRFNPITLTSVGGGTGFGWMVALSASVSSAVPFGSPISWLESS